jgi:pyruvate dehydrogenase E2 component (dihydrolipoamide acetyltransferase)
VVWVSITLPVTGVGISIDALSLSKVIMLSSADSSSPALTQTLDQSVSTIPKGASHASPSIRKLARELGVDLSFSPDSSNEALKRG